MQWLMLQQDKPEDFVIATGRMESVRKFIEICAKELLWFKNENEGAIIWKGTGINEVGIRSDNNQIVIRVDPNYFRPTEVDQLLGDYKKAELKLGWSPKTSLEQIVKEMIIFDQKEANKDALLKEKGFQNNKYKDN